MQLELFPISSIFKSNEDSIRICVQDAFDLLWKYHLEGKPSARSYRANRDAWIKSIGNKYLDEITFLDLRNQKLYRSHGTNGFSRVGEWTIFHDHTIFSLLFNKFYEWKRDHIVVNEIDFSKVVLPSVPPIKGVKKIKGGKRKRIIGIEEFSRLMRCADKDLADLFIGLIDTGARLNDALSWKPSNYNAYTDQIEFNQSKNGKEQVEPVSNRLRRIIINARTNKKCFIFNKVNLISRYKKTRKMAGLEDIQLGRDFRKTTYNAVRRESKDPDIARQILGHTTIETGENYYYIEEREELRPIIMHLEKTFIK